MNIIQTITSAAKQRKIVIITYKDAKGNVSSRETEPYEIKDNAYWGWSLDKNAIRKFSLDNILSATLTNKPYQPRFEVKL